MKWIHKIVIFLVIATLAIVQYYRVSGNRVITAITPDKYEFIATSDRVDRGISTSQFFMKMGSTFSSVNLKNPSIRGLIAAYRFESPLTLPKVLIFPNITPLE